MQLYLDSFGAFLAVRNGAFWVRLREAGERAFAVRQVDAILLTRGTAMSADALLLAVEHDVPVLLIDAHTHRPLAQVFAGRPGNIATVRKQQALFAMQAQGMAWVAATVARKIDRQRAHLRALAADPEAPDDWRADTRLIDTGLASLQAGFERWQAPADWTSAAQQQAAQTFRGQEGTASRLYFQHLSRRLSGRLAFDGRSKRPAYDPFNALLNYLYGMLYTQTHLALLKSGLDPYLGVLHVDQHGDRPTLVFDFIEPFRPWAETVATALVLEGLVDDTLFEENSPEEGFLLSRRGKDVVIGRMLAYLQAPAPYGGRQVKRGVQIDLEAQGMAARM
ncbi:MAG: CRISPR-associated endonuclease Cas1 [Saprospiraceae bacterium]|nr:CRISPR-associated endonuclease Cas1 [Saprospiraceae bacterium]